VGVARTSIQTPPPSRGHYIELWGGHSTQFFTPAHIGANETKTWSETYFGTVGLSQITTVNEFAASYLSYARAGDSTEFTARVFTAVPSIPIDVILLLHGAGEQVLLEQAWTPDPTRASTFTATVPSSSVESAGQFGLRLETQGGAQLHGATIDYSP